MVEIGAGFGSQLEKQVRSVAPSKLSPYLTKNTIIGGLGVVGVGLSYWMGYEDLAYGLGVIVVLLLLFVNFM